ncbi:hypothetical protein ACPCXF_17435 [Lysinibacillus agricola]
MDDIYLDLCLVYGLIGVETGRLLGDHSVTDETLERAVRRTKAKSITSCDNASVTYIVSAQAAHRTPLGKRPVGTEINHTLW